MKSFYSRKELQDLGFAIYGSDVLVSRKAIIENPNRVYLGDCVRIDDYCTIKIACNGYVRIGSFVHIGAHAYIDDEYGFEMKDFAGLSGRSTVLNNRAGIIMKYKYSNTRSRPGHQCPMILQEHAVVGSSSILLPGVSMGLCSAAGAMSLVNKAIPEYQIHAGIPAKFVKDRKRTLLKLGELAREEYQRRSIRYSSGSTYV